MTVRDAEAMAARPGKAKRVSKGRATKDADTMALEKALSDSLGMLVTIMHKANGSGEVRVRYSNLEQLDAISRRLHAS
jgi:ParB family chromosome partitioning protein